MERFETGVLMKTKGKVLILGVLTVVAVFTTLVHSHCQIPCGIYDDAARFVEMREHVTTIEKSMTLVQALSAEAKPNMNQLVRWVMNKENHADALTEIVTYYFMTQRLKPAEPTDPKAYAEYINQLTLLHRMMVEAMKAKQSTDQDTVANLRKWIDQFEAAYFKKTVAEHTHVHSDSASEHSHTH